LEGATPRRSLDGVEIERSVEVPRLCLRLAHSRGGQWAVHAEAFDQLVRSVRQAGRIRRGALKASRTFSFAPADVKAIRKKLGKSQPEFALMIGVSVATLRNWEQGRRTPEGPALALLRVASVEPRAVTRALRGAA
jgi:putative transcriptional regulator